MAPENVVGRVMWTKATWSRMEFAVIRGSVSADQAAVTLRAAEPRSPMIRPSYSPPAACTVAVVVVPGDELGTMRAVELAVHTAARAAGANESARQAAARATIGSPRV